MTEEDKKFVESWRLKNDEKAASKRRINNDEVAVSKAKKKPLSSLTTGSSCATTYPPMDVANTIVSSSIPILQSSTVSSVQPAAPLFHSSNTHPVESVSNNVLTILPDLSSSPTPVSNDHAFPVLSLPSSSFASTSQPSVSLNIPPNHLLPLTPLNLSVTSDDLSLPTVITRTHLQKLYLSVQSTQTHSLFLGVVSHIIIALLINLIPGVLLPCDQVFRQVFQ